MKKRQRGNFTEYLFGKDKGNLETIPKLGEFTRGGENRALPGMEEGKEKLSRGRGWRITPGEQKT